jgi:hypothetical protein
MLIMEGSSFRLALPGPLSRPRADRLRSPDWRTPHVPVRIRHALAAHPGSDCGILYAEKLRDLPHSPPVGAKWASHACEITDTTRKI